MPVHPKIGLHDLRPMRLSRLIGRILCHRFIMLPCEQFSGKVVFHFYMRLFPLAVLHAHSGLITYALLVRTADTPWGVSPLRDRSYWTFNSHAKTAPHITCCFSVRRIVLVLMRLLFAQDLAWCLKSFPYFLDNRL